MPSSYLGSLMHTHTHTHTHTHKHTHISNAYVFVGSVRLLKSWRVNSFYHTLRRQEQGEPDRLRKTLIIHLARDLSEPRDPARELHFKSQLRTMCRKTLSNYPSRRRPKRSSPNKLRMSCLVEDKPEQRRGK